MKILIVCIILLLSSCRSVEVSYEKGDEYLVYAINSENSKIEEVYVDYVISSAESIFLLYTIYQNQLPIGYYSCATSNVELLNTKVKNKEIYYSVDNYILLCNVTDFKKLLAKTAQLYDFYNVHIILNNNELI